MKLLQNIITPDKIIKEYNYPEWNYCNMSLPRMTLLNNINTTDENNKEYYYPGWN